ncbi:MAG: CHASE2 domain-containing protein [Lentisphaeraceae bacterium]|nr:CHASE2 domain-containing protein [Lentisphaeraceae bacterium]
MVLKVRNSRLLIFATLLITIAFGIIYFQKYSIASQTHTNNFGESYEAIVRDSLMRLSYNIKDALGNVSTSQEVTVIGIDDETSEKYGKFGGPLWNLRIPYDSLFRNMQKHFLPSCLAIDIIFKRNAGKVQIENGIFNISEDTDVILKLSKVLKTYTETYEDMGQLNLLQLSTLVAEQGETLIGNSLANLQDPFDKKLKPLPVVLAYSLEESETMYGEKIDFNNPDYFKWTDKDVIGEDPDDPSEDLGDSIPYLKKMAIPEAQVSNLPEDLTYLPYGNLVSTNFIDYVRLGFINNLRDSDGIVRRSPLILATKYYNSHEKKLKTVFLPSMTLLSCLAHLGAKPSDISVVYGDRVDIEVGESIKSIPIDRYGRLLLNFNFKPKDMNYVPFGRINEFGAGLSNQGEEAFKGEFKESLETVRKSLTGNICMIGLTFTGNSDTGPTAIDTNLSLVYVHAAAVNGILKNEYLVPASDVNMSFIMLGIFIALGAGSVLMSINGFTFLFAIIEITIGVLSLVGIYYSLFYFPTLFLLIFAFAIYIFVVLYRYFSEEKEKFKIRNMFSTMVSSSVLDYMESNPGSFSLSGSKMSATIMFSDVAGFTTISEGLNPEQLVQLLNKYLTPMTDIIQDSGGYVDKYEGDAIMAEWGVPFPNDKHATLACYACLDQQKKLDEIREALYEEFGYRLQVRIGANSGDVSAGNMGSENRFSYTVMGDAVNLAARLEPTNKVYGTYLMIGENTYDLAKDDIEARLIDKVVVMGKKVAIRVYELLARKGELSEDKQKLVFHYEKGLQLHEERKWDEAIAEFNKALEVVPDDEASKVLIKRVEEYKENPPGEDWQGEYVRKSKD